MAELSFQPDPQDDTIHFEPDVAEAPIHFDPEVEGLPESEHVLAAQIASERLASNPNDIKAKKAMDRLRAFGVIPDDFSDDEPEPSVSLQSGVNLPPLPILGEANASPKLAQQDSPVSLSNLSGLPDIDDYLNKTNAQADGVARRNAKEWLESVKLRKIGASRETIESVVAIAYGGKSPEERFSEAIPSWDQVKTGTSEMGKELGGWATRAKELHDKYKVALESGDKNEAERQYKEMEKHFVAGGARGVINLGAIGFDLFATGAAHAFSFSRGKGMSPEQKKLDVSIGADAVQMHQIASEMGDYADKAIGWAYGSPVDRTNPAYPAGENVLSNLVPIAGAGASAKTIAGASEKILSATERGIARSQRLGAGGIKKASPMIVVGGEAAVGAAAGHGLGHELIGIVTSLTTGEVGGVRKATTHLLKSKMDDVIRDASIIAEKPNGVTNIMALRSAAEQEAQNMSARMLDLRSKIDPEILADLKKLAPDGTPLHPPDYFKGDAKILRQLEEDSLSLNQKIGVLKSQEDGARRLRTAFKASISIPLHGAQGAAIGAGIAGASSGEPEAVGAGAVLGATLGAAAGGVVDALPSTRAAVNLGLLTDRGRKGIQELSSDATKANLARLEKVNPEAAKYIYSRAGQVARGGTGVEILTPQQWAETGLPDVNAIFMSERNKIILKTDRIGAAESHEISHAFDEARGISQKAEYRQAMDEIVNSSDPKIKEALAKAIKEEEDAIFNGIPGQSGEKGFILQGGKKIRDPSVKDSVFPASEVNLSPQEIRDEITATLGAQILGDIPPERMMLGKRFGKSVSDSIRSASARIRKRLTGQDAPIQTVDQFGFPVTPKLRKLLEEELFAGHKDALLPTIKKTSPESPQSVSAMLGRVGAADAQSRRTTNTNVQPAISLTPEEAQVRQTAKDALRRKAGKNKMSEGQANALLDQAIRDAKSEGMGLDAADLYKRAEGNDARENIPDPLSEQLAGFSEKPELIETAIRQARVRAEELGITDENEIAFYARGILRNGEGKFRQSAPKPLSESSVPADSTGQTAQSNVLTEQQLSEAKVETQSSSATLTDAKIADIHRGIEEGKIKGPEDIKFMPTDSPNSSKDTLVGPAIETKDGIIIRGFTHDAAVKEAHKMGLDVTGAKIVYTTKGGKVMEQEAALKWGQEIGQLPEELTTLNDFDFHGSRKFMPASLPVQKDGTSKAWISPTGETIPLTGWHSDWLKSNPDKAKKWGIRNPEKLGHDEKSAGVENGAARINITKGEMIVEATQKAWPKIKDAVRQLAEENADYGVMGLSVKLFNDNLTKVVGGDYARIEADSSKVGQMDIFSDSTKKNLGDAMLERNNLPVGQMFNSADAKMMPASVNIGLDTKGGKITAEEAITALKKQGVEVSKYAVHQSDTEPTLVATLSRPLTPEEANRVSAELNQEAIAQHDGTTGELYGPKSENWKPFNEDYFLTHDGKKMSDAGIPSGAVGSGVRDALAEIMRRNAPTEGFMPSENLPKGQYRDNEGRIRIDRKGLGKLSGHELGYIRAKESELNADLDRNRIRQDADRLERENTPKFMPSSHPEAIDKPAVRFPDGKIYTGYMHAAAWAEGTTHYSAEQLGKWAKSASHSHPEEAANYAESGYVKNDGTFVNSKDALDLAIKHKQVTKEDIQKARESWGLKEDQAASKPIDHLESMDFESARRFMPQGKKDLKDANYGAPPEDYIPWRPSEEETRLSRATPPTNAAKWDNMTPEQRRIENPDWNPNKRWFEQADNRVTKENSKFMPASEPNTEEFKKWSGGAKVVLNSAPRTAHSLDDVGSWWNDEGGANETTAFSKLTEGQQKEARQRFQDEVLDYQETFAPEEFKTGEPVVVGAYHGTNEEFHVFDPEKLGEATGAPSAGEGFFFSGKPETAESYANPKPDPVALSKTADHYREMASTSQKMLDSGDSPYWTPEQLRRHIEVDLFNADKFDRLAEEARNPSLTSGHMHEVYVKFQNPLVHDFKGEHYRDESYYDLLREAKDKGHDGAIFMNTFDGADHPDNIFVSFDNKNIKSTANKGSFDPSNPDIRFMPSSHPDAISEAAIRDRNGKIFKGGPLHIHAEQELRAHYRLDDEALLPSGITDGFIDKNGKFYTRKQALIHAERIGQVTREELSRVNEPYADEIEPAKYLESQEFEGARKFMPGPIGEGLKKLDTEGKISFATEEEFWNKSWPKLMKSTGLTLSSKSEKNINKAAANAVEDVHKFLTENPRFSDYYNKDWQETKRSLDKHYDKELSEDEMTFFKLAKGLTSPNTALGINVQDAMNVTGQWLKDGHLDSIEMGVSPKGNRVLAASPVSISGTTNAIKAFTLKAVDKLSKELGGPKKVADYLMESVPVSELQEFNKSLGYKGTVGKLGSIKELVQQATGQSEKIPRMFVFGRKVGAYTLNLLGEHRYQTIDAWESRFIRSQFKDMATGIDALPKGKDEHTLFTRFSEIFNEEFNKQTGLNLDNSALQAARWFYMLDSAREAGYTGSSTAETISHYVNENIQNSSKKSRGLSDAKTSAGSKPKGKNLQDASLPEGSLASIDNQPF